jgi:cytochrome c peroxidase
MSAKEIIQNSYSTVSQLCLAVLCFIALTACDSELNQALKIPPTPYNFVVPAGFPAPILPDDNPLTNEGIELGRHLFYDTKLSRNNTQSCASCHAMNHALTDNGKKLSTGIDGIQGTRNAMPLFNLAWNASPYFWDGRAATLRQQVLMPIQDPVEMHETLPNVVEKLKNDRNYQLLFGAAFNTKEITNEGIAQALEQFLLSIVSGNARYDQYLRGEISLTLQELNGRTLFDREFKDVNSGQKSGGDCFHCHGNILFTTNKFTNNGLDASFDADKGRGDATGLPQDVGKFKIPTLRNIALTAPYMHDGRFETLTQALEFYNFHQKTSATLDPVIKSVEDGLRFTPSDIADMEAFLNTLTDTDFVNNPAYQNPF